MFNVFEKLLKHLMEKTMEGEIVWSALDVIELSMELAEKKDLSTKLGNQLYGHQQNIARDIRFLALKGVGEKEIIKAVRRTQIKIDNLAERMMYCEKHLRRLEKRMESIKPEDSSGWYVDVKITGTAPLIRPDTYVRVAVQKRVAKDGSLFYLTGYEVLDPYSSYNIPDFQYSTDEFAYLHTLGILLKKKERIAINTGITYTYDYVK